MKRKRRSAVRVVYPTHPVFLHCLRVEGTPDRAKFTETLSEL